MKLENYSPTFRSVLITEMEESQTQGGIYLPPSAAKESKNYYVLKVGPQATEIKPGDIVKIMNGIHPESIELDKPYLQVMEQQIIGYSRST